MHSPIKSYLDIEGWFPWEDHVMFEGILRGQSGDSRALVELGVYLGQSAVVMGRHRNVGDRFVAIDLFGSESELDTNQSARNNLRENRDSYRNLTRAKFESNYLALHSELPEVVQGLSSCLPSHVAPGTARFIHIDASHLYPQVAEDIRNAEAALGAGGVVVLDDYRSVHTPGVAAAVWEAVRCEGMVPFALTPQKMYATWGDSTEHLSVVRSIVQENARLLTDEQWVLDHPIVRVHSLPSPRLSVDNVRTTARKAASKVRRTVAQHI